MSTTTDPVLVTYGPIHKVRLSWYFPIGDHLGGNLGEEKPSDFKDPAERQQIKAMQDAALDTEDVERDVAGFFWHNEQLAIRARRIILAAQTAAKKKTKASWPAWALKAKSEGWKPPRGWRP